MTPIQIIKEKLMKLSYKFGSASDLVAGLNEVNFDLSQKGIWDLWFNEDGWQIEKVTAVNYFFVNSRSEEFGSYPQFRFVCDSEDFNCQVGFGVHHVELFFDVNSGKVVWVKPDDFPSERCWGEEANGLNRIEQVLNIIADFEQAKQDVNVYDLENNIDSMPSFQLQGTAADIAEFLIEHPRYHVTRVQ